MMRTSAWLVVVLAMVGAAGVACSTETDSPGGDGGSGSGGSGGSGGSSSGTGGQVVQPNCTDPAEVPCSDQVIQQLNLQSDPAPGAIDNQPQPDGWFSVVDASAGGFNANPPHAYVYARFTEAGLEKVAVSDMDALDAMDWDIAFRRYVLRINSANSGPSCVTAARLATGTAFDDVTGVPEGALFDGDTYYTPDCTFVTTDGVGGPSTKLGSYYTYGSCVTMTGNVYIVSLADGRLLKLTVEHYYTPPAQEECETSGQVTDTSTAGHIGVRWAFLP